MENTVRPISAIICFNSGSAGDLLLSLCSAQLKINLFQSIDHTGAVNFKNQHFKEITKEIFYHKKELSDINFSLTRPIENTHYYLDFYPSIAKKIYFIDYPDHYGLKILETVKKKRYNNSWSVFLESNRDFLPEFARNKVTVNDVPDLFVKRWNKNLQSWRTNHNMIKVDFLNFFDPIKMQTIVETIIEQPVLSTQDFQNIYQPWLEKNLELFLN